MFLLSVKNFRFWFSCFIIVLSVTLATAHLLSHPPVSEQGIFVSQNDAEAYCRSFLSSHGWTTAPDPPEVTNLLIPEFFDDVFSAYNVLQLSQGYDLTPLQGKTLKKYVFKIVDYPGRSVEGSVIANILMNNGEIVGGDICSLRLDGFMHGFSELIENEHDQTG